MSPLQPHQARIADDVLLDGRLALFHQREHWLAVADLHFGYEISQRVAGRLMPMWGMTSVRERLLALIHDYQPKHLVIVGDLVHDRSAAPQLLNLLVEIEKLCDVVALAGNHDRQLAATMDLRDSWITGSFHFNHGHCLAEASDRTQIIGHHHPASTITDGAGLRLKLPAFVQQNSCWILPAFSPWASGTQWTRNTDSCVWVCSPQRVLRLPNLQPAKP